MSEQHHSHPPDTDTEMYQNKRENGWDASRLGLPIKVVVSMIVALATLFGTGATYFYTKWTDSQEENKKLTQARHDDELKTQILNDMKKVVSDAMTDFSQKQQASISENVTWTNFIEWVRMAKTLNPDAKILFPDPRDVRDAHTIKPPRSEP